MLVFFVIFWPGSSLSSAVVVSSNCPHDASNIKILRLGNIPRTVHDNQWCYCFVLHINHVRQELRCDEEVLSFVVRRMCFWWTCRVLHNPTEDKSFIAFIQTLKQTV